MERKPTPRWRKHVIGLALGAGIGMAGAAAGIRLARSGVVGDFDGSQIAAGLVGLIYLLTALAVAAGLLSPKLGAQYLNVENAEELREQRRLLAVSVVSMVLSAVMLFVLAVSGTDGILPPSLALATVLALLVAATGLTLWAWRLMDELMRQVSSEGGNVGFYLMMLVGGGWAFLAYFGLVPAPAPLDWITMFYALGLVGSFVAAGRRGLLGPR